MPNYSQVNDPRFWERWRSAGAVGTVETSKDAVVTLPDRATMLNRLLAINDNGHVQERFIPLLLQHAGTEKVGEGIVMMVSLAIHDYTQGMPPMMMTLMYMNMDRYIDALAGGNRVVVKRAKEFFGEVTASHERKVAAQVAAAKPAKDARNAEGITDDKRKVMEAARKIADMIFTYANTNWRSDNGKPYMEDRRSEPANAFYSQTKSGLFLEFYYGHPSSLWTPWGKWGFGGSGGGTWNQIPEILQRLGATVYMEERNDSNGTYGPVYAVHAIDGEPLPEPVPCPRTEFLEYETTNKEWKELNETVRS